jgi:ankyrin repeat protein
MTLHDVLRYDAPLDAYRAQAEALRAAWAAGEPDAIEIVRHHYPPVLDERIPWLPRPLSHGEFRGMPFGPADARLTLARWYDFADWDRLVEWIEDATRRGSPVARFESAAQAVVDGDEAALAAWVRADPDLVRARSTRVTHFDPPVHGATLLHYVAANGVEAHRQKTPPNAVAIARLLLDAGADVDALAAMYGGRPTTLSMLVSSSHPAAAGVQVPLIDVLVDAGAAVDGAGEGAWTSPLLTALAFGFADAAAALVRRGARVDTLPAAAGLGRTADARVLLALATADERHRALALASQLGHADVVGLLLDAGEDPDRYNPIGHHAHSTPLHQAVWSAHFDIVRLLVERGARLDIRDTIWSGTPLGWADYGGRTEIAEYLRANGAT